MINENPDKIFPIGSWLLMSCQQKIKLLNYYKHQCIIIMFNSATAARYIINYAKMMTVLVLEKKTSLFCA